jgi:hypothetical protein
VEHRQLGAAGVAGDDDAVQVGAAAGCWFGRLVDAWLVGCVAGGRRLVGSAALAATEAGISEGVEVMEFCRESAPITSPPSLHTPTGSVPCLPLPLSPFPHPQPTPPHTPSPTPPLTTPPPNKQTNPPHPCSAALLSQAFFSASQSRTWPAKASSTSSWIMVRQGPVYCCFKGGGGGGWWRLCGGWFGGRFVGFCGCGCRCVGRWVGVVWSVNRLRAGSPAARGSPTTPRAAQRAHTGRRAPGL